MNTPSPPTDVSVAKCTLVGVFDSGVGGLSVLRSLKAQLPNADFLYLADSGHAPYGERSDEYIRERTLRVASYLLAQGAAMLVLACNTATAMAAAAVRERWPHVPLVAVEPGLKPAVAASRNGRIGVMATPATLRSDKFQRLVAAHGHAIELHVQACPGLAGLIEQVEAEAGELAALVASFAAPLRQAGVDTVVLGCTHYPFVIETIQAAFDAEVKLIDTADAVARQAARLLGSSAELLGSDEGLVCLQTTGEPALLERFAARWLPFRSEVKAAPGL